MARSRKSRIRRNMFLLVVASLALALTNPVGRAQSPDAQPAPRLIAIDVPDESSYDARAERELLALANRARTQSDLPPLQMDSGLAQAARVHAAAMASRGQLSHQFSGEPGLAQRLAANCPLYLDEAAENAAFAESVDRAHAALLKSPAHRENLLHPSYNVVGIGIVRRGSTLYVVQDFGHSLPVYSSGQAEDLVAKTLSQLRDESNLPALQRRDSKTVQSEACSMGKQDLVRVSAAPRPAQGHFVVHYTTSLPQSLPSAASK